MKYANIVILSSFLLASCNFASNNSSVPSSATITNLGDIERLSPLKYLSLKCEPVIVNNNKIIVDGELINSASLARYADVVIQVFCLNDEGQIIKREKVVAVDNIFPNSRLSFKSIVLAADGTGKVIVKLFDASGEK